MTDADRRTIAFFDYEIHSDVDLLFRHGTAVRLEPRPVRLLRYLAEHHDRVVSKEELLDHVWSDVFTADSVLKRAISQCRKALGEAADASALIGTYHGVGYRFLAPVSERPAAAPPARGRRGALPSEVTSFVGRDEELLEVERLLEQSRLVTIAGTAGVGKTRFALALARRDVARRESAGAGDGVAWVELDALADAARLPTRVAAACGLGEDAQPRSGETIADLLGDKDLLLVLDNCEHLLDACARLASALLRGCEHVRVLATSREPLSVAAEQVWRLRMLSVPDADEAPERLHDAESVRLFVDRVRAIAPTFEVTGGNAAAVSSVCRQLEGLPLAIELAAARAAALSVEEIASRLGDRFRILTRGDRTAPDRQRTLRAAIDWSYDLLEPEERRVLRWLSVFRGFDLDAARAVVGLEADPRDLLDEVARLVDKSLVVRSEPEGPARYRLLETIREYAAECLDPAERERATEAHARWVLGLTARAEEYARGPREREWLTRLEVEHDNIREALGWSAGTSGDWALGARLAAAMTRFWDMHGHWGEGLAWLERWLARPEGLTRELRAKLLHGSGLLGRHLGDYDTARARLSESLALWRGLGNERGIALTLNTLGNLLEFSGERAEAVAMHEESLERFERLGDRRGRAMALSALAYVAVDLCDYETAAARYEESLAISREIGDLGSAGIMLHNLGDVAHARGDLDRARALQEESLEVAVALGFRDLALHALTGLGTLATEVGDLAGARGFYAEAMRMAVEIGHRKQIIALLERFAASAAAGGLAGRALLLGAAASAARAAIGAPIPPDERGALDRALEPARLAAGATEAEAARARGLRLRLHDAVAIALEPGGPPDA